MVEYNKKLQQNERITTTAGNIFRATIVDLKPGTAGKQLETLISFLSCCGVDVGSIRHKPPSCALLDIVLAKGGPASYSRKLLQFNEKPTAVWWAVERNP